MVSFSSERTRFWNALGLVTPFTLENRRLGHDSPREESPSPSGGTSPGPLGGGEAMALDRGVLKKPLRRRKPHLCGSQQLLIKGFK